MRILSVTLLLFLTVTGSTPTPAASPPPTPVDSSPPPAADSPPPPAKDASTPPPPDNSSPPPVVPSPPPSVPDPSPPPQQSGGPPPVMPGPPPQQPPPTTASPPPPTPGQTPVVIPSPAKCSREPVDFCTDVGFYPDTGNACRTFYECSGPYSVCFACPQGTAFNSSGWCDTTEKVTCGDVVKVPSAPGVETPPASVGGLPPPSGGSPPPSQTTSPPPQSGPQQQPPPEQAVSPPTSQQPPPIAGQPASPSQTQLTPLAAPLPPRADIAFPPSFSGHVPPVYQPTPSQQPPPTAGQPEGQLAAPPPPQGPSTPSSLPPQSGAEGPSMGTDLVPLDFTYRLTQYNLSNFDVSAQTQYTEFIYSLAPGVTTVEIRGITAGSVLVATHIVLPLSSVAIFYAALGRQGADRSLSVPSNGTELRQAVDQLRTEPCPSDCPGFTGRNVLGSPFSVCGSCCDGNGGKCPAFYQPPNGCGPSDSPILYAITQALIRSFGPDLGDAFNPFCDIHDICYSNPTQSQAGCDIQLRDNLVDVCNLAFPGTQPPDEGLVFGLGGIPIDGQLCLIDANQVYSALNEFGAIVFKDAQAGELAYTTNHCQSCAPSPPAPVPEPTDTDPVSSDPQPVGDGEMIPMPEPQDPQDEQPTYECGPVAPGLPSSCACTGLTSDFVGCVDEGCNAQKCCITDFSRGDPGPYGCTSSACVFCPF